LSGSDGAKQRRSTCAGSYRRRTVQIDCGGCPGSQDLTDRSCLVGALRLLAKHPSAERIDLVGTWEVGYDSDVVAMLAPLARIFESLETIGAASPPSHACRQCNSSPESVTARILERFPLRPMADDLRNNGTSSGECDACINRTRAAVAAAGREYGRFESSLTRRAFKVVGGGTDAGDPSQGSGAGN
jgi:hypothetical protein